MDQASLIRQSAMEALRYQQHPQLFQALVSTFQDALQGDLLGVQRAGPVIQQYTGMAIQVSQYENPLPAAFIYIKQFDPNHILRNPGLRSLEGQRVNLRPFAELLKEAEAGVKADGSVYGLFTQFPANLYLSSGLFQGGFSAEEIAALTLHEVGHQYSYFEMVGRTLLASVAIAELEHLLDGIENLETRSHYIESTAAVLSLTNVDVQALAEAKETEQLRYVFIRDVIAQMPVEYGNERVFNGEVEFMADSYAVRMGAARPLVSALTKIFRSLGDRAYLTRRTFAATEATKAALTVLTAGVAATFFPPSVFAIGTVISALLMAHFAQDITERSTPPERLEAIHHDLVALLKDRSLPKEEQAELVKDVAYVSTLREEVKDRFTIMGVILYTLLPLTRRTYKQIKLQQDLSRFIHNDLFVKAAQLRQLSSVTLTHSDPNDRLSARRNPHGT
jgi:hypothetical protein